MSVITEEVERLKKEVVEGQKLRPTTDADSVTRAARSARPQRPGEQIEAVRQIPYQVMNQIFKELLAKYRS